MMLLHSILLKLHPPKLLQTLNLILFRLRLLLIPQLVQIHHISPLIVEEEAGMAVVVVEMEEEDVTPTLNVKFALSQIILLLIAGIGLTLNFRLRIPKFKLPTLLYLKHHHHGIFKRHMVPSQVKTSLLVLAETMDMVYQTTVPG